MHDSRGAALKKGDRVLIEAEITQLSTGGNENFCCVDVKVVTPDQPNKEAIMQPPSFSALSTRMLTKIGAACLLLALFATPSFAQDQLARLTALESQFKQFADDTTAAINGMAALNARIQADVKGIKEDVAAIKEQLAAPKPQATATTKMVWQPATSAWGACSVGKWVSVSTDTHTETIQAPMMGFSSMSSGACANGSCSSGAGMRGIGIFRLRR